MQNRNIIRFCLAVVIVVIAANMAPVSLNADTMAPTLLPDRPRLEASGLKPPAEMTSPTEEDGPTIRSPHVRNPSEIYNNLLVPELPPQSAEATLRVIDGPSVLPRVSSLANGGSLTYANVEKPTPCVDFNDPNKWASNIWTDGRWQGDLWNDHYAGWGAFAIDDGGFYNKDNVTFSKEQAIGNGLSAKVSSNQPYAAGFISPLIAVEPGAAVEVTVRYLIANGGTASVAHEWTSLGIKPDATVNAAYYVNGLVHGAWAEMQNIIMVEGDQIVIMIHAESPAAINSNVYFDDIEIFLDGVPIVNCEF